LKHKAKIIGVALLCIAFGSAALTLGRAHGAALIGRPLEILVPVQMDAGEDASSLCFDAEVFHADTRQEASRVRVVVEATAQAHMANVRILSSALVDEPVVTVYLRTGCGQKTTRRYVLLADFPSEVAAASASPVVPALASAKVDLNPAIPVTETVPPTVFASASGAPVSVVKTKTAPLPKQTVRRKVASKRPEVKTALAASRRTMSDEKSKTGRPAGQSRLKLDPLELLSDRVANLDSYMTFAPTEDALRSVQKIQALEGDVTALRALDEKNEASLVDLKARLQKAEAQRFPDGLIYALIVLVLACLTAVVFLWSRQRRLQAGGNDWWSGSIAAPASIPPEPEPPAGPVTARGELDGALASEKTRTTVLPRSSNDSGLSTDFAVSVKEMSHTNFDDFMQSGAAHSSNRKPPPLPSPTVVAQRRLARSLNSDAILDARQQAEFFVSLGQTHQAVQILKHQIAESDEPNPFVYLDLLSIFHSLSQRSDFQHLREDFDRLFNGRVPEFMSFKDEGRGLESYPDVLSRITDLWPTPKVLDVIEACVFQDPRHAKSQSFDLAAFRDLLLLHAVAQGVVRVPQSDGGESEVGATLRSVARISTSSNLAESGYAAPAPASVPVRLISEQADLSPPEIRFPRVLDLDLDLSDSEMEGVASNPVSTADVDLPLLMPDDREFDSRGVDAARTLDSGNLIDFDLPETPAQPGLSGNKPADRK